MDGARAIRTSESVGHDDVEDALASIVAASERAARIARGEAPASLAPGSGVRPPRVGTRAAWLAGELELDADTLDFVWAVIARATDPRMGAHLRAIWGSEARVGLSVAQYAALRDLAPERVRRLIAALAPGKPLRSYGLVETTDDMLDVDTRWSAPARVWGYLCGDDALDPAVASVGGLITVRLAPRLSPAQHEVLAQLATWLGACDDTTIVIEGAVGSGRQTAAALAAHRPAVTIDFARVALHEAAARLTALVREATLRAALPILANLDELWTQHGLAPTADRLLQLARMIDELRGPVVITTSMPGLELHAQRRTIVRARWPLPDVATRRALWTEATGEVGPELELVAARYALGAGGIANAARSAARRAGHRGEARPAFADVVAGVQDNIAERLGELARRVEVTQTWGELVLPADTVDDVCALVGRVRRAPFVLDRWGFRQKLARGTGVAALFSGPPGTGKTMVAGLLARELQLELYQVDLSRIVSKWVGETEKQLARVFEAAEAGHALLLFDEADALFAKRSAEVKSAVDRYANLEVNYLLQRIESFGGVVVLTTNLDTSIDPALRRRLASHIVFGAPEAEERAKLWRGMLATGAPLADDLAFAALADEFPEMTGANIRNAALAAAFLAAEDGRPIAQAHLRRAARSESRAMGRVLAGEQARRHGL
jgi:hypothetical protein